MSRSSVARKHPDRLISSGLLVALSIGAVLLALDARPAQAWGRTGHSLVTEAAIDALPAALRPYFRAHREFLVEHSVDPDLWRAVASGRLDPGIDPAGLCSQDVDGPRVAVDEGPRHYLDADALEPFPFRGIPRDFETFRAEAGDKISTLGTGPWTIASSTEMLAEAMANGDEERVLCRAAILAHYVADFAQPFHLTVNFNGQLSGLEDIHYRFESDVVDAYESLLRDRIRASAARGKLLADPVEAAFEMIVEGYPAVDDILLADLRAQEIAPLADGARGSDSPEYIAAFWARGNQLVSGQLAHGAASLASFWMTAWDRAGRPDLSARPRRP